jgi:hypothetical protein
MRWSRSTSSSSNSATSTINTKGAPMAWAKKSALQDLLDSTTEEAIFAMVASELASNEIRAGLWAKALAECEGDEKRTTARYIQLRAASLAKHALAQQEIEQAALNTHPSPRVNPIPKAPIKGKCPHCEKAVLMSAKECTFCNTRFLGSYLPKQLK